MCMCACDEPISPSASCAHPTKISQLKFVGSQKCRKLTKTERTLLCIERGRTKVDTRHATINAVPRPCVSRPLPSENVGQQYRWGMWESAASTERENSKTDAALLLCERVRGLYERSGGLEEGGLCRTMSSLSKALACTHSQPNLPPPSQHRVQQQTRVGVCWRAKGEEKEGRRERVVRKERTPRITASSGNSKEKVAEDGGGGRQTPHKKHEDQTEDAKKCKGRGVRTDT